MTPLLSAHAISVRHGATDVLTDVDFSIDPGEVVTIIGPNGSGKSTLLRALIGAQPVSKGQVRRAPDLVIGYVPQRLTIDGSLPLTVRRFLSLPKHVTDAQAEAALARNGVSGIGNRPLSGLSGGQFQRVLLARALLTDPQILILDEPTQGLDQPGTAAFYRLLDEVRGQTGCAVLMVSHDLHVVMASSGRVVCLNGHVCCAGTPKVVASAPEYRALFGHGTGGAFALYQHDHNHDHDGHGHDHPHPHRHS